MPLIQKANAELEAVIRSGGAESVQIDASIRDHSTVDVFEDEQENQEEHKDGTSKMEAVEDNAGKVQTIVLEFATGDFDGSAIAQAEEGEKEDEGDSKGQGIDRPVKEGAGLVVEES